MGGLWAKVSIHISYITRRSKLFVSCLVWSKNTLFAKFPGCQRVWHFSVDWNCFLSCSCKCVSSAGMKINPNINPPPVWFTHKSVLTNHSCCTKYCHFLCTVVKPSNVHIPIRQLHSLSKHWSIKPESQTRFRDFKNPISKKESGNEDYYVKSRSDVTLSTD